MGRYTGWDRVGELAFAAHHRKTLQVQDVLIPLRFPTQTADIGTTDQK